MSIDFRTIALALGIVASCAVAGWSQSPSRTLSYEAPKPRAESDSVREDSGRATTAAFNDAAEAKQSAKVAPAAPSGGPSLADSCSNTAWDDSYFYGHRDGAWFGGAEYLLIRPHFSQDAAMMRETLTNPQIGPSVSTDTAIGFDYDYTSSIRAFIGYRLCDCGGEIQFTYWSLDAKAGAPTGTASATSTQEVFFFAPNELSPQVGGTLSASARVNVNAFDLDFSKRIPLGDCDCACCPAWDLKWSAGVRIASVAQSKDRAVTSPNTAPAGAVIEMSDYSTDFRGAGPRLGLEGRRYFGECGNFSLFARGSGSLLLGQFDSVRTINNYDATGTLITIDVSEQRQTRIIPVAELEVGGTWQVCDCFQITAGWLFQAWWDLGQTEVFARDTTGFDTAPDSNILSFDGLFVRAEYCF